MRRLFACAAALTLVLGATACEKDPDDPNTWLPGISSPGGRADALRRLEHLHKPSSIHAIGEAWKKNNKASPILHTLITVADADEKHPEAHWKDAVPYLQDAVQNYSPDADRSVDDAKISCEALGKAADPSTVDTLIAAATQSLPKTHIGNRVRIAAIGALASFPKDPKVIKTLIAILEADPDKQLPQLNGAAALALAKSGDPQAVPALTKALFLGPIFNQVREAMTRIGKPAIDPMIGLVQEQDKDVNDMFLAKGWDTRDAAGNLTAQKFPGNKISKASQLLGDLKATKAIPVLLSVLKDPKKNNGHQAVLLALLAINDPTSAKAIRDYYLDKGTDDSLKVAAIDVYSMVSADGPPAELLDYADGKAPVDDPDIKQQMMTTSLSAYGRLGKTAADLKPVEDRIKQWSDKLAGFQAQVKAAKKDSPEQQAAQQSVDSAQMMHDLWQDTKWRIDVAVECKEDATCYAKYLTAPAKDLAPGQPGQPHAERALFELAHLGAKGAPATDALLTAAASPTRFIREGVFIALPHVAQLPCQKCVDKLQKIVDQQKDDTTLSLLVAETEIARNFYLWAGK